MFIVSFELKPQLAHFLALRLDYMVHIQNPLESRQVGNMFFSLENLPKCYILPISSIEIMAWSASLPGNDIV